MKRREFIGQASKGITALAIPSFFYKHEPCVYSTVLIATGWWGINILDEAMKSGKNKIVALCDVDRRYLIPAAEKVKAMTGQSPRIYTDYQELLQKEKPQIAIVATPDHWHALPMIEAVKSGLDVWVQKPISVDGPSTRKMLKLGEDSV